jgi:hypothetical protein
VPLGKPAEALGKPEGERVSTTPPSGPTPKANLRIVFAVVWVVGQVVLVLTADRRVDGAFGFRMFPESSTLKIALFREVDGPPGQGRQRIHVDAGVWNARSADGISHRLTWYDRVPTPYWIFDQEMPASYGARTQLARLAGALDDVASHVPNDAETHRFILEVIVRRNGREPVQHQLVSRERTLPHAPAPGGS